MNIISSFIIFNNFDFMFLRYVTNLNKCNSFSSKKKLNCISLQIFNIKPKNNSSIDVTYINPRKDNSIDVKHHGRSTQ